MTSRTTAQPTIEVRHNAIALAKRLASRKTFLYVALSIGVMLLFGFRDIAILMSKDWPHLYAMANVPTLSWEEVFIYLPSASQFSLSNPLPAAPQAFPGVSAFYPFTLIPTVLQGILLKGVFFSNLDVFLLAAHTLFPLVSFWVLFLIYRKYLQESWAFLLSLGGVTLFTDFSAVGYLFGLLTQAHGLISSASLTPPELTRTPIPSLSFIAFVAAFYLTIRKGYRLSMANYIFLSVVWGLQAYVYPFNFIAGAPFWFGFILLSRYFTDRGFNVRKVSQTTGLAAVVFVIVGLPILLMYFVGSSSGDGALVARMQTISESAGVFTSDWGPLVAYLLPTVIMLMVIWISCGDYYEAAFRFGPVFLMLAIEVVILNLNFVVGWPIQPQLFSIRIGDFFNRYLYFVPIIYFLLAPQKRLLRRGALSTIYNDIYPQCASFVAQKRVVIACFGCGVLAMVVIMSGVRYARGHDESVATLMQQNEGLYHSLILGQEKNAMLMSEAPVVDMMLPLLSNRPSLLVNQFGNDVPREETEDRLLLFGRVCQWSTDRFLSFMLPQVGWQEQFGANGFLMSEQVLNNGFGYWLLNQRKPMTEQEQLNYATSLRERFGNYDVAAGAFRYGLAAAQCQGQPDPALQVSSSYPSDGYTIYVLNHVRSTTQ